MKEIFGKPDSQASLVKLRVVLSSASFAPAKRILPHIGVAVTGAYTSYLVCLYAFNYLSLWDNWKGVTAVIILFIYACLWFVFKTLGNVMSTTTALLDFMGRLVLLFDLFNTDELDGVQSVTGNSFHFPRILNFDLLWLLFYIFAAITLMIFSWVFTASMVAVLILGVHCSVEAIKQTHESCVYLTETDSYIIYRLGCIPTVGMMVVLVYQSCFGS
jgi:hypothetical protein